MLCVLQSVGCFTVVIFDSLTCWLFDLFFQEHLRLGNLRYYAFSFCNEISEKQRNERILSFTKNISHEESKPNNTRTFIYLEHEPSWGQNFYPSVVNRILYCCFHSVYFTFHSEPSSYVLILMTSFTNEKFEVRMLLTAFILTNSTA